MPKSLVWGQDEPDFYAVDDFMWIMVELLATASA